MARAMILEERTTAVYEYEGMERSQDVEAEIHIYICILFLDK